MIIALIIYSSALGDSIVLKYSVLIVIGLAIALGLVPSVRGCSPWMVIMDNKRLIWKRPVLRFSSTMSSADSSSHSTRSTRSTTLFRWATPRGSCTASRCATRRS